MGACSCTDEDIKGRSVLTYTPPIKHNIGSSSRKSCIISDRKINVSKTYDHRKLNSVYKIETCKNNQPDLFISARKSMGYQLPSNDGDSS